MALNGTQLLGRDVARYLRDAGWHDANLVVAVAVSHAESAFYTEAENDQNTDGTIDYGIMQINSVHIGQTLGGVLCTKENCFDPEKCARMARGIYRAQGWAPWAAYGNGAYKQYLDGALHAVANLYREILGMPLPS